MSNWDWRSKYGRKSSINFEQEKTEQKNIDSEKNRGIRMENIARKLRRRSGGEEEEKSSGSQKTRRGAQWRYITDFAVLVPKHERELENIILRQQQQKR